MKSSKLNTGHGDKPLQSASTITPPGKSLSLFLSYQSLTSPLYRDVLSTKHQIKLLYKNVHTRLLLSGAGCLYTVKMMKKHMDKLYFSSIPTVLQVLH